MKKISYLDKLTVFSIVLIPIFSSYKSIIPKIDLGMFIFLVVLFFNILKLKSSKKNFFYGNIIWIIYITYIIFSIVISSIFNFSNFGFNFFRFFKHILIINVLIYYTNNKRFNFNYAIKIYCKVAVFASLFIYLQTILFYFFNIKLAGYFPNLIMYPSYASRISTIGNHMFRPTSIFFEPAHFIEFVILSLIFYLFYFEKGIIKIFIAFFITSGIFLSTSGQGMIIATFIWMIWICRTLKKKRKREILNVILISILGIILMYFLFKSENGRLALERIFSSSGNHAAAGRIQGYIVFKNLSLPEKIFGIGYGNVPNMFFTSLIFNLICIGYVGTFIYFLLYLIFFKYSKKFFLKLIVVINFILSVSSTAFMGVTLLFYFMFIVSGIIHYKDINKNKLTIKY